MPEWVTLTVDTEYEINPESIEIRHKQSLKIVRPFTRKDNYKPIKLGTRLHYLYKIIAIQFIQNPNPENYKIIDHIDRNRLNNSIENLRFVSPSLNNRNRRSHRGRNYYYFQTLPKNAIQINPWPDKKLRDSYYEANGEVYVFNTVDYRQLYKDMRGRANLAIVAENGRTKYKKYKPTQ
jgi:hypothetical protein